MKIIVFGAGSIGTYVGGALLASGADVLLIGRTRMRERISCDGLELTDLHGRRVQLVGTQVPYLEDHAALADADLILVTVKSADTATAAQVIRQHAKSNALVLSLQNGIGNVDCLRAALPTWTVLAGMVPFNVVQMPGGRLHRGTAGELMVEASSALGEWHSLFAAAHLPLLEQTNFKAVQWGKLLLNLNNAINALSDLPLKTELSQRAYRRCLAALMDEARQVLRVAGIVPVKVARVAPNLIPTLLRLPDSVFKRVAASMLHIDPEARSSMWEDLQAKRRTEVDYLNGAVVRLAESLGRDAPLNRRIVDLIRAAENGKLARMGGDELYCALYSTR